MDRQLGVTDDVREQHMRDFQLNFFFYLRRHMTRRNGEPPKSLRLNYRESRAKAHSKIAAHRNSILPISIQSVYSSQIVPVVQRIEQGFPKGKRAFLQESPNDVRSTQLPIFEVVDQLLHSSRVVSSLPIFTYSGDTTGDTNCYFIPPYSMARRSASISNAAHQQPFVAHLGSSRYGLSAR